MEYAALITGASSGIGKELAFKAASEGKSVVLVARSKDKLNQIKKELQNLYPQQTFSVFISDLSKADSAKKLYEKVSKKFKINMLINNAGFGDYAALTESNEEKLTQMVQLNCSSLVTLTRLAAEDMAENNSGYILNVASVAAFFPGPYMATYYATKAFVLSFTEAIAEELKTKNVVVSALCPGPTQSEFDVNAKMEGRSIFKDKLSLPTAKEVADYGYHSLISNKTVAIHGTSRKLGILLARFLPRGIVRKLVSKAQS